MGSASYPVQPEQALYSKSFGEFLLPYEAVATASDPDEALMAFLQSTYEAAANEAWMGSSVAGARLGAVSLFHARGNDLRDGVKS